MRVKILTHAGTGTGWKMNDCEHEWRALLIPFHPGDIYEEFYKNLDMGVPRKCIKCSKIENAKPFEQYFKLMNDIEKILKYANSYFETQDLSNLAVIGLHLEDFSNLALKELKSVLSGGGESG